MTKREQHIAGLKIADNWIEYLKENSNLPGKRANLELLYVISDLGDEKFFLECLTYDETIAPVNSKEEFVAACGVAGLGTLIRNGKYNYYDLLRQHANDGRWRTREAVAMALQKIGLEDFNSLIKELRKWIKGNPYEKRAVVAGLCEPALIKEKRNAEIVLDILNEIIDSIKNIQDRKSEPFRVLKKGLGYGLSVAIVAHPEMGKLLFEKLKQTTDPDVNWILKENLKKKRLERMDLEWTSKMKCLT